METLYWEPPKADELGPLGLRPEDFPPPTFELWAENWPVIQLFTRYSTQWRVGSSGVVGLDYNVIFHELDRKGLEGEAYDDMMASMRIVEEAAVRMLNTRD